MTRLGPSRLSAIQASTHESQKLLLFDKVNISIMCVQGAILLGDSQMTLGRHKVPHEGCQRVVVQITFGFVEKFPTEAREDLRANGEKGDGDKGLA